MMYIGFGFPNFTYNLTKNTNQQVNHKIGQFQSSPKYAFLPTIRQKRRKVGKIRQNEYTAAYFLPKIGAKQVISVFTTAAELIFFTIPAALSHDDSIE